jgi:hypothetical protein
MVWPFKHKHKVPTGYGPFGTPYGELCYFGTDGLGTGHWSVMVRCETCKQRIAVASIHVPKDSPVPPSPPAGFNALLQAP